MTHLSNSVAETESIAAQFARLLHPGDVVALHGQLGAGKTQFARGLVRALGGADRAVSSPTYVLLNVYPTPTMQIFHLDAYRIAGESDFEAIGFSELLEQNGIVIVEWPERVASLLPTQTRHVYIEAIDANRREIKCDLAADERR